MSFESLDATTVLPAPAGNKCGGMVNAESLRE
jgi:hypothetical protein